MVTISEHPSGTRRGEIISAARRLCVRDGLDSLRMRGIADAVGISAPAIYRHFADKDALVYAVVEGANEVLGEYLRRSLDGADARRRFELAIESVLEFALAEKHDYALLFVAPGRMHPDRLPFAQQSPNFIFWLNRIRECVHAGTMRRDLDPVLTGITVWAQIHGLIALHIQGRFAGDEGQFRGVFKESMALVLNGLSYDAHAQSTETA